MNEEDTRTKLMLLIREQDFVERELQRTIQEYYGYGVDDVVPYRKIIREDFGLVI